MIQTQIQVPTENYIEYRNYVISHRFRDVLISIDKENGIHSIILDEKTLLFLKLKIPNILILEKKDWLLL